MGIARQMVSARRTQRARWVPLILSKSPTAISTCTQDRIPRRCLWRKASRSRPSSVTLPKPYLIPVWPIDSTWNRWIVTADAFAESSTVQRFFIAVSTTADPTGSFFIYNLNVTFFVNDFFDFPQLGMDQDAI